MAALGSVRKSQGTARDPEALGDLLLGESLPMEVLYLSMIDIDRHRPPLMNGLLARVPQVDL
jgi:hypothetical protein